LYVQNDRSVSRTEEGGAGASFRINHNSLEILQVYMSELRVGQGFRIGTRSLEAACTLIHVDVCYTLDVNCKRVIPCCPSRSWKNPTWQAVPYTIRHQCCTPCSPLNPPPAPRFPFLPVLRTHSIPLPSALTDISARSAKQISRGLLSILPQSFHQACGLLSHRDTLSPHLHSCFHRCSHQRRACP